MKYFAVLGVQPIREKLQHGTGKYTVASFVQYKQTRTQEACTCVAETWVGWNTFISVSKRDVFIDHFHKWRLLLHSFVLMLIRPTALVLKQIFF